MQNLNESLQAKYPHLELAVLSLSQVNKDNESKRIDSEYFKKEYLENEKLLLNLNSIQLKETDITIKHPAEIARNYIDSQKGVWFFRTQNLRPLFIDCERNQVFISNQDAQKLRKNIIEKDDILITRTGANCGDCAIYNLDKMTIASSHILIAKNSFFNQYFLAVFLNTIYGIKQINRGIYGGLQPEIAPYYLKNIYIPQFSQDFQLEIEKLVKQSHEALEDSKRLYKEAQELLYKELELDFKNPLKSLLKSSLQAKKASELAIISDISKKYPHLNISVRPLSKSLHKSGRLDSEYYQSKYDLMETKIKTKGFKILQEICSLINYGSVPTSPYTENGEGIPYIKGLNLKNLEINEYKLDRIINTENLDSRFFTKENDIIISQMGTVGDCGVVSKAQENYIFASFTIRIRLKNTREFNPYFIALYIQYIAKEWYLLRNIAQASVRQNTDLPTIRNLYVPLINPATQEQIALKIQQSFTLRAKSKDLLQNAKMRLENAIENG